MGIRGSSIINVLCFLQSEYITQVDLKEERENQEVNARKEFEKGKATTVPWLLEKFSRCGQMPFYYCSGLEILSQAITDCEYSLYCSIMFLFSLFPLLPASLVHLPYNLVENCMAMIYKQIRSDFQERKIGTSMGMLIQYLGLTQQTS